MERAGRDVDELDVLMEYDSVMLACCEWTTFLTQTYRAFAVVLACLVTQNMYRLTLPCLSPRPSFYLATSSTLPGAELKLSPSSRVPTRIP